MRLLLNSLLEKVGGKVRLKLDVQGQGGGQISDLDGQGRGGSSKLDNFHGRHICIIPKILGKFCKM